MQRLNNVWISTNNKTKANNMNILTIANKYPFPINNGYGVRIFNFVKELKEIHKFDLLSFNEGTIPEELEVLFENIYTINKKEKINKKSNIIKNLFFGETEKQKYDKMKVWMENRENISKYDIVWIVSPMTIFAVPLNSNLPLCLYLCDDEILFCYKELMHSETAKQFFYNTKKLISTYFLEKLYYSTADIVILISERDQKFFSIASKKTKTKILNNGVDVNFYKPLGGEINSLEILFLGSMDFPPNSDAVIYFSKTILPIIIQKMPNVQFTVIGKKPTMEMIRLNSNNIKIVGEVEDVRPYFDKCSVFVCPLRRGGGMKNKILEAWAMQKAVVATSVSIGGLLIEEDKNIVIKDNPKDFAAAVVNLLNDDKKRKELGFFGRKTVLEKYTWRKKAEELEEIFYECIIDNFQKGEVCEK